MAYNRRIRCFSCKQLVLPEIDYNDIDAPYAVVPINLERKRGCVCSDCIEYYSANDEEPQLPPTNSITGLSNDRFMNFILETFTHKPPQGNTPIISNKNDCTVCKNDSHTDTNESSKTNISENNSYLQKFSASYSCLGRPLDDYVKMAQSTVFGQDEALKRLVYTIYFNQMSNCIEEYSDMLPTNLVECLGKEKKVPKRKHVLLVGGTGVGKTLLATTVAKMFNITYSVSNATPITSAGYIGDKVENVLERLYNAAKGNIQLAENGIIILDEFDKKAVSPDSNSKDVTGKAVQQELLKILEPSEVWICKGTVPFYTGNLTVIMMGAFVGLEDIIANRLKVKRIGFNNDKPSVSLSNLTQDDLIEYGFIPEIVGRIPIVLKLNDLTKDILIEIIYTLLNKYNVYFKTRHYDLIVNPLLIDKLANESLKSKTGARDLDAKIDELLQPALYQVFQSAPEGVCHIHSDGSIELLTSDKKSNTPIIMDIPPIRRYEDSDGDELSEK